MTTVTETTRYGTAVAGSWDRLHPRLAHRSAWQHHDGELPVIEGTLIRLTVDHLPGDRDPKPVWLWWSRTGATPAGVVLGWMQYYGAFYRSALLPLLRRVNAYLMRWLRKKYKRLASANKARACWQRITSQYPRLFAHWAWVPYSWWPG